MIDDFNFYKARVGDIRLSATIIVKFGQNFTKKLLDFTYKYVKDCSLFGMS